MEELEQFARERIGQVVGGKWRLESVLGVGGMAAVYAGRDESGAVAAIKILHPEMSRRPEVRERFWRESYVANNINHPGVVRALEHGTTEQGAYLVMELLSGEPLSTRFKRTGTLPVPELLEYLDQILDVLACAHEAGVIHRDLKPDNLFVTTGGRIKILDFGLARVLESVPSDQLTRTGVALGTLPYMAPEQALGRRAEMDGRVDIFALGATAFRILAGRRIHEGQSEAELLIAMATRPAPPLKSAAPHVPNDVCAVIDMALAFSRESRYPDARTMQADVRALKNGQPPPFAMSRQAELNARTRQDAALSAAARAAANGTIDPFSATAPMSALEEAQIARLAEAQMPASRGGGTMPMRAFAQPPSQAAAPHGQDARTIQSLPAPADAVTRVGNGVRSASAVQLPAKAPESRGGGGLLIAAGAMFFVLGAVGTVGYFLWSAPLKSEPPPRAASALPVPDANPSLPPALDAGSGETSGWKAGDAPSTSGTTRPTNQSSSPVNERSSVSKLVGTESERGNVDSGATSDSGATPPSAPGQSSEQSSSVSQTAKPGQAVDAGVPPQADAGASSSESKASESKPPPAATNEPSPPPAPEPTTAAPSQQKKDKKPGKGKDKDK